MEFCEGPCAQELFCFRDASKAWKGTENKEKAFYIC